MPWRFFWICFRVFSNVDGILRERVQLRMNAFEVRRLSLPCVGSLLSPNARSGWGKDLESGGEFSIRMAELPFWYFSLVIFHK